MAVFEDLAVIFLLPRTVQSCEIEGSPVRVPNSGSITGACMGGRASHKRIPKDVFFCGGARTGGLGGRTLAFCKKKQYDSTKGYPGEDVYKPPSTDGS